MYTWLVDQRVMPAHNVESREPYRYVYTIDGTIRTQKTL